MVHTPLAEVFLQIMRSIGNQNRDRESAMPTAGALCAPVVAFPRGVCPSLLGIPHGSVKNSQGIQRIPAP